MAPELTLSYSLRCRNCRYSRIFGYARISAECRAVSHSLRKTHTVDIMVTDLEKLESRVHLTIPNTDSRPEGIPF